MSLILQSSGGGQITIQEPATASNFTQTLPAADGTILTTGSPQSGSVIQVVNASTTTTVTSTSTSYSDTTLTATITPKFASSKILVLVNQQGILPTAAGLGASLAILRGSTNICQFALYQSYIASGATTGAMTGAGANFLDSPATTSPVTYKTQVASTVSGSQVAVQNNGDRSTITLMEIAA